MGTKIIKGLTLFGYVLFLILFGFFFVCYHSVGVISMWRNNAPSYPSPAAYMIFNFIMLFLSSLIFLAINIVAFSLIYFLCTL
jgi:hypothetical protein